MKLCDNNTDLEWLSYGLGASDHKMTKAIKRAQEYYPTIFN